MHYFGKVVMSSQDNQNTASAHFPAANFSYSSQSRKSLSFVDYGESPAYLFKLSSCNNDVTTFGHDTVLRKDHGDGNYLTCSCLCCLLWIVIERNQD